MPTTLPVITREINNAFMTVWEEIRDDAADNISKANVVTAALKLAGRFTTQVGGAMITRRIRYNLPTSDVVAISKGDVLGVGEQETVTEARWPWRYVAIHIQRSLIDDQQCAGKFAIVDYVKERLTEARDAMSQVMEQNLFRPRDATETAHKYPFGLNDIVPPYASYNTGTCGLIAKSNDWWQCRYKAFTLPLEVNLVSDMRNLWNTCGANQSYPDLLITTQSIYELYEDFGVEQGQVLMNQKLLDLGFENMKFKGADLVWVDPALLPANTIYMLNTQALEFVYDPKYWMQLTSWERIPRQLEVVAHIVAVCNLITKEPRRHGLLYMP